MLIYNNQPLSVLWLRPQALTMNIYVILCNTVLTIEAVMTFSGCDFFDHQCNHGDRKVEEFNDVTMVLSVACVKGGQMSNSHC